MVPQTTDYIAWPVEGLVDPRGVRFQEAAKESQAIDNSSAWPIRWANHRVGLLSNKKPNADAMLEEVKRGLQQAAPGLSFVYGSKEPLAENAPETVIQTLLDCDVVIVASAECGGCTSWVCRDSLTLEKLGVPSMVIATDRFEKLARTVLSAGGIQDPRLIIPRHPVSGITAEQAQSKIRVLMDKVTVELFGTSSKDAMVPPL